MCLPMFYRTSPASGVPEKIEICSTKTLVFIFISKHIVADKDWVEYISSIPSECAIIPIALDNSAFQIGDILNNINFIRSYEYDTRYYNDLCFIAISHEIYRLALNERYDKTTLGIDNSIKIFISHAKDNGYGLSLAKKLKEFVDNSSMRNFFDATDIAPGYNFSNEIVGHIKESTIVSIQSDIYSSRYWCQRELLCAKENCRPIIAVDILEEYEDRSFPFGSNIPVIRVDINSIDDISHLYRILRTSLLETIRFFYSKLLLQEYKKEGWIAPDTEILSRPPEVSDIKKLLYKEKEYINYHIKSLVYPEPPVYSEELDFISNLGITVKTPLSIDIGNIMNKKIGISISEISPVELESIGQHRNQLIQLSQDIARHLLAKNATLIYGGDLRNDGFTEFLLKEAMVLKTRLQSQSKINLKNYIAWPIYNNDSVDTTNWKATYRSVAEMIEVPHPDDIKDLVTESNTFISPDSSQNRFIWSRCLTEMRTKMISDCDFRIFAGGKHSGYTGKMPGILEEIIIALDLKKPIYLLGGFGGVTSSVCKLLQDNYIPKELTYEWQADNNEGYNELLEYSVHRASEYSVDYNSIVEFIRDADLNNGLSGEDNVTLFSTPFIDEALKLVFKGIRNIISNV